MIQTRFSFLSNLSTKNGSRQEVIDYVTGCIFRNLNRIPTGSILVYRGPNEEHEKQVIDSCMSARWATESIYGFVKKHILAASENATIEIELIKGTGLGIIEIVQEKGN